MNPENGNQNNSSRTGFGITSSHQTSSRRTSYDDMLNLPHHQSKVHAHMSMIDRAAQFSPFAALTGYDSAIEETARLTDRKAELDENEKAVLDRRLHILEMILNTKPQDADSTQVSITYFEHDLLKEGGHYITLCETVRKIDFYNRHLLMSDGTIIPTGEISAIEGAVFSEYEDGFR